jgi:hypothetical protein
LAFGEEDKFKIGYVPKWEFEWDGEFSAEESNGRGEGDGVFVF